MTVITKPSLNNMKPDEIKSPLVVDIEEGPGGTHDVTAVHGALLRRPLKRSTGALLFMTIVAILVAVTGMTCGLVLYRQYLRSNTHRYQAYCSVPYPPAEGLARGRVFPNQKIDPEMGELISLRWSPNPEVQVFNVKEKNADLDRLREEFDIRGRVERIRVEHKGQVVNFVHDFDANVTGIVDQFRCFVMTLDPSLVLAPETLELGIQRDRPFDVAPVRSTLSATLPPLSDAAHAFMRDECVTKPTYRLEKRERVIRKRSAELPAHDYVQFAGQKVQEIEIANMDDVLQYERDNRK